MGSGANDYITFNKGPYDTSSEVMRIQADGKTGIGTDAPAEKLSVVGNISASGTITVLNGDSNKWNSVYTTTSANSARWSQAYTNLVSNSAAYLSGVDISLIATTSGSWNSVYTTTKTNSANWQTGYNNAIYTVNGTANQIVATPAGSNTGNNSVTIGFAPSAVFPGDLSVRGNLYLTGSAAYINTSNLVVDDSLIYLANSNVGNLLDIGLVAHFTQAPLGYQHTGFVRRAGEGRPGTWTLFSGLTTEPLTGNNIDWADKNITLDSLSANIYAAGGNSYQWSSNYTTTNSNSANWSNWSSVSGNYALGSQYVKLSGDTMTGALSAPALSADTVTAGLYYGVPYGGSIDMRGSTLGSGGSINTTGGINGAGGSINTSGSNYGDGGPGGSINTSDYGGSINTSGNGDGIGGYIDTSGNDGGTGGSINTSGNGVNGGNISTYGGADGPGGSINTYNNGGAISTNDSGGYINTSGGGGYIRTTGGDSPGGYISTYSNGNGTGGYIDTHGEDGGGSGGYINTTGHGGYINTTGSNSGATPGGYINTSSDNENTGGYIDTHAEETGGSGGYIRTAAGTGAGGGYINTSGGNDNNGGGGYINTSGNGNTHGGYINTSGDGQSDGGNIDTTGTGSIGFGCNGTRTTVQGTATTNRSIYLPDADGTLALGSQYVKLSGDNMTGLLTNRVGISSFSLSARFIDLVHLPANDGTNPVLRFGEYDTAGGNVGFSGMYMSYNEVTNAFGISAQFAPTVLPAINIDRNAVVGARTIVAGPAFNSFSTTTPISAVSGLYVAPSNGYTGVYTFAPIAPLDVEGTMTYVASAASGTTTSNVKTQGNYVYTINYGSASLASYDITSGRTLVFTSSATTDSNPQGLCINGKYAYVVTANTSSSVFQIFDISNPSSIALLSTSTIGAGQNAFDVIVQGNYAYILTNFIGATNGYIVAYDISNPYAPVKVFATQTATNGNSNGLSMQGKYLYWSMGYQGSARVYRMDVSDPRKIPAAEQIYSTGGSVLGTMVRGKYL